MPIKVIGAGFGRTGTLSLKFALEELGFTRCDHMTDVLAHVEVPVPTGKPFPHLNAAAEFKARIKRISLIFRMISLAGLAVLALVVAGVTAFLIF